VIYIKNKKQLLSHGNIKIRKAALDIIEYSLEKADPYIATKNLVFLKNNNLHVGRSLSFNLHDHKRIFILGAGKATFPITKALEEIVGDKITDGVIICKYGQEGQLSRSRMYYAAHPVPDKSSFNAAQKLLALAKETRSEDIIFSCITGGSSALASLPIKEISLDDKIVVNKLLLACGANIIEINTIRKHLSQIKGGWLAKNIHPEARIINLTVSDVIGDPLDYITCPTVADTSTFEDVKLILNKYKLWEKLPTSVINYFKYKLWEKLPTSVINYFNDSKKIETPKDLSDHQIYNFVIVPGDAACIAAEEKAKKMGFNTMILFAKEVIVNNRPLKSPCVIIGGGETTIKLEGDYGIGGPNQEFVLSAGIYLEELENNIGIVGIDTDGTDGPTNFAGALMDRYSITKAKKLGISLQKELDRHNESAIFKKLNDNIITGHTGTNVSDLKFIIIV